MPMVKSILVTILIQLLLLKSMKCVIISNKMVKSIVMKSNNASLWSKILGDKNIVQIVKLSIVNSLLKNHVLVMVLGIVMILMLSLMKSLFTMMSMVMELSMFKIKSILITGLWLNHNVISMEIVPLTLVNYTPVSKWSKMNGEMPIVLLVMDMSTVTVHMLFQNVLKPLLVNKS